MQAKSAAAQRAQCGEESGAAWPWTALLTCDTETRAGVRVGGASHKSTCERARAAAARLPVEGVGPGAATTGGEEGGGGVASAWWQRGWVIRKSRVALRSARGNIMRFRWFSVAGVSSLIDSICNFRTVERWREVRCLWRFFRGLDEVWSCGEEPRSS